MDQFTPHVFHPITRVFWSSSKDEPVTDIL